MATVAASDHYTDESRRFMQALLDGEPNTANGGLYANKAGYHNKRENLPMPGMATDYSIKAATDKQGPADKSAGYDWTFNTAHSRDYRRITHFTKRVEAAFWARDPRLRGWREVLGCIDGQAVGFDFDSWNTRQPDDTHEWHMHLSEHREHLASWDNKAAMLEVLGLTDDGSNVMLCTYGDVDDPNDPRGGRVAALQARLWFLGYDVGSPDNPTDGHYGPKTRDALKAACATVGWDKDGTAFWAGEYAALEKAVILHWAAAAHHGHDGGAGPAELVPHTHAMTITGSVGAAEPA